VDEANQELVGLLWDANARQLVGMGFKDLTADANSLRQVRN
jgi:hypothetical protein